jgi:hypothetical protein
MRNDSIHARERVTEFITDRDLDRLAQLACAAAEASPGWQAGEEFVFPIKEEPYSRPGIASSAFIVCHQGTAYEIFYYDGLLAETITAHCSWDRQGNPPSKGV